MMGRQDEFPPPEPVVTLIQLVTDTVRSLGRPLTARERELIAVFEGHVRDYQRALARYVLATTDDDAERVRAAFVRPPEGQA